MECAEAIDVMGEALEGILAQGLHEGFQGHLDECPPCRNYFHQLRLTREALGRLPHEGRPNPRLPDLLREFEKERDREEN